MKYSVTLADTLMRRFPDPDAYPYRSWSYPQGFMLWGFIRLYEKTGKEEYRSYVMRYCEEHVAPDGSISGFTGCSLDDIMAGSVLVWAYRQTGEEKYKKACDAVRAAFSDYPRNSDGGFWHGRHLPGEMWVDGLFMGLMFLTRYGAFVGDREACFAETVRQLNIVFARCEKDNSGLLYHGFSENPETPWASRLDGHAQEIWCEGLGWYAMILVEVLALMPRETPGYDSVLMQLQKLLASLKKVQDPLSGLWFQVVDRTRTPGNWHDTSGSAMFLYTFRKASLCGFCGDEYDEVIRKGFEGIKTKCLLDLEGNLNVYDACDGLGIQVSYDHYIHYTKNVNAKEAVAAVLWASVAMEYEGIEG